VIKPSAQSSYSKSYLATDLAIGKVKEANEIMDQIKNEETKTIMKGE